MEPVQHETDSVVEVAPSRRGHFKLIIAAALVATVAVAALVGLLYQRHKNNSVERYGQDATTLAKKLKICSNPKITGTDDAVVTCTFEDYPGGVVLTTTRSDLGQELFVSMVSDQGNCNVVVKGFIVGAASRITLTRGIGLPEEFARRHHGYVICG